MKNLQEILDILGLHKAKLFKEYPLKSMAIFGSFARNEQTQSSDLDVVVEFSGDIGIRFVDLAEDLERIIGSKVDVVSKKGIKEKYLKEIASDMIYV